MSIGVIRKWRLDQKRYPGIADYAKRSGLVRDRGAGTRSPLSSLKPTSTDVGYDRVYAGNPSPSVAEKWALPEQSQDCPDCQGEGCYTCQYNERHESEPMRSTHHAEPLDNALADEDWGSLRPDKGPKNDFPLNSFQFGEPMDLAFRLLKIEPGLEGAARNIAYGSGSRVGQITDDELPQEEGEPEEEGMFQDWGDVRSDADQVESEMDRLKRELKVAQDALARSKKIQESMGQKWKKPTGKNTSRGNVQDRQLPRSNVELGY